MGLGSSSIANYPSLDEFPHSGNETIIEPGEAFCQHARKVPGSTNPLAMIVSIFNDVVGPVMRGPSSSHCAAALRLGRLARDLMEGQPDELLLEFDRRGSLPATYESQLAALAPPSAHHERPWGAQF